jgi:hypothetical protein
VSVGDRVQQSDEGPTGHDGGASDLELRSLELELTSRMGEIRLLHEQVAALQRDLETQRQYFESGHRASPYTDNDSPPRPDPQLGPAVVFGYSLVDGIVSRLRHAPGYHWALKLYERRSAAKPRP